jgi:hypothetical protein
MSYHGGLLVTSSSSRKGLGSVWRTPHISRERDSVDYLARPRCSSLHDNSAAFPPCRR